MVTLATCLFAIVTPVLPKTLPLVALTEAVPNLIPVSSPVLLIEATLVGVVLQVTLLVTSPVELSPKVAVAVYCCVTAGATVALVGCTRSAVMVFLPGKNWPQLVKIRSGHTTSAIRKSQEYLCTQLS